MPAGTLREYIANVIAWGQTTGQAILPVGGTKFLILSPSMLGLGILPAAYLQQLEQADSLENLTEKSE